MKHLTEIEDLTPTAEKYYLGTLTVTSKKFAEENPELAEIFLQVTKKTIDWMNANPKEAGRILAEEYEGVDAADIEKQITAAPVRLEISESAYDTVANLMYEMGTLPAPPKKFSELPNYDTIPKTA